MPLAQELLSPLWRINTGLPATPVQASDDYGAQPYSLNDMISNCEPSSFGFSYISGVVNLQPIHAIYVHSNLNTASTMDSIGRKTIIAKIPVTTPYGFTEIYRTSGFLEDAVDVGGMRFQNVSIALKDVWNQPIDLRGAHVSFELSFAPM